MKKKRGFTLIELLAVIVILAIIAIIAIPIILNMIENARKGAARDTAYGYIDAIEYNNGFADSETPGYTMIPDNDDEKEFYTVEEISEYNLKYRGKGPDSGVVTIKKRKVSSASLCIGKYKVDYNGKEVNNIEKSSDCSATGEDLADIEVVIEDKKPCELATETKDSKEIYYIDSAEDLYAFSESVNGGNDYSGKTVVLRNSIDLSDYTKEKKTKVCTDNDNANGFTPIGTSDHPFKGNFEGGGKTISNITINKASNNYVGLFGVINGSTIKGLTLDTVTVNGYGNTGSLVGYAIDADIYEIVLKNYTLNSSGGGYANLGGLVGILAREKVDKSQIHDIIIRGGNINAPSATCVGGELGRISSGTEDFGSKMINKNIVVEDVNVNARQDAGIITGNGWAAYQENAQYSANSTYKGSTSGGFAEANINDINFYEALGLDTWIDGDNDNSGYYFDYNKDGEIIIVSTKDKPIPNDSSFKKDGEYLLIKNEKDWRKATALANKNKKFKLAANLNFENNKYYMMGSYYHPFKGIFEGGAKTISNVTINADTASNIGMFGTMRDAKIKGLTIDSINIKGYSNVGSLSGNIIDSEVSEIMLKDYTLISAASSYANLGGLVGILAREKSDKSQIHDIIIRGGNINAPSATCVGGELGRISSGTEDFGSKMINKNIVVEDVNVNARQDAGIITGNGWVAYQENAQYSADSTYKGSKNGGFAEANINDINFYEAIGLDTWIDGDNDDSGYYFDYDKNGVVVLVSKESKPIPTDSDFEKDGDYLLIKNEDDWKKAAGLVNKNKKFKLNNNLNFSTNKYYMMGSVNHPFKGVFNGNAKAISNVTINANTANNIGMFGTMKDAKLYALHIKNVTVNGYSGIGSLAGRVIDSEVAEILAENITVTSNGLESYQANAGGLVGILSRADTQSSKIHDILMRNGTVTSPGCSTGGELGRIASSDSEFGNKLINKDIILENVSVSASCSNGADKGIISPGGWLAYNSNAYYSTNCTLNGGHSGGFDSSNIDNLNYYKDKIETKLNGDNNNTGYYFDSVNGKVVIVPSSN